ncbi:MAG: LacI family transcriptional regulator [Opitutaceae bacterium]|jgi:DNA-binding LacI/PurR family transcriptional regulator|nr:LacI family transcriptional regulator [Opitutaceae bacterium]
MVTLKQIAQQAGVSIRSVSVVLNGKAVESRISSEMTQRIQRIARELDYRPNAMARAIRLKKSFQIGVLVRELANPYTGAVIEAMESCLLAHGYKLLLGLTDHSPEVARAYLSEFSQGVVDGILNLDPVLGDEVFVECKVTRPYIHYMRPSPGYTLRLDYRRGMELGLSHLWKLGHRHIGFISGPPSEADTDERLQSYMAFFEERQLPPAAIEHGAWTFESGYAAAQPLVERGCTAIFAANDLMAVGAAKAILARKLTIPGDLSVVGFDDSILARMMAPSLTSVHVPTEKLATQSVEALIALIAGKRLRQPASVKPTLALRESTGPSQAA